jgi:hypothetical protein
MKLHVSAMIQLDLLLLVQLLLLLIEEKLVHCVRRIEKSSAVSGGET